MSGIAGIFNLDGRPADVALLRRMTAAIAHRGPDREGHWVSGAVALGHRMLWTTPEALHEQQPLADETGDLCLTLDGRVDNREELRVVMEAEGAKLLTDTDAELVLRAYQCWGEDCAGRILGDFAFVIWDARRRRLFCARDPMGIRPFCYYYAGGGRFHWASEPHALFEDPSIPREPNEGMIAEYLAVMMASREETLYRHILRLPPSYWMIVEAGSVRTRQYWSPESVPELRYRRDEEYAEHLLQILKEAVRCRLRSYGPVAAELSGGLDSSSVVGLVQQLEREGTVSVPGFETFSLVFPGQSCDESDYIADIVKMWGLRSHLVPPQPLDPGCFARQIRRYQYLPDYPSTTMSDSLRELAVERGHRVLLSGAGGDDWLTGSPYRYADLLRGLRVIEFLRQAWWEHGLGISARSVLRYGLWPLLPGVVRQGIKAARTRFLGHRPYGWIGSELAAKTGLAERLQSTTAGSSRTDLLCWWASGWLAHAAEMGDRSSSAFGLERRHPFHDQRVVRFAFAVPGERVGRRQTKTGLRLAMRTLLPETVCQRNCKAEFSEVPSAALRVLGGERAFRRLAIASLGWVDEDHVRLMYHALEAADRDGTRGFLPNTWELWTVWSINTWLQLFFVDSKDRPDDESLSAMTDKMYAEVRVC